MNARGVAIVLALCLFAFGQPALHAADGWSGTPSSRPTDSWFGKSSSNSTEGWFGSSSQAQAGGSSTAKKSSKSSWFPWPSSKPKSPARSKPSMVQKVTRGTKDTWNKTVSFLNPFDNKPTAKATSKEPTNKPNTVTEWLSGEMPSY